MFVFKSAAYVYVSTYIFIAAEDNEMMCLLTIGDQ